MNFGITSFLKDFIGDKDYADHNVPLQYLSLIMQQYMLPDTHEIIAFKEDERIFVFELDPKPIPRIEAIMRCAHRPLIKGNNIFLALGLVLPKFSPEEAVTLNIKYNAETRHYSWTINTNDSYKRLVHQAFKAFSMANIVLGKVITPHLNLLNVQPST